MLYTSQLTMLAILFGVFLTVEGQHHINAGCGTMDFIGDVCGNYYMDSCTDLIHINLTVAGQNIQVVKSAQEISQGGSYDLNGCTVLLSVEKFTITPVYAHACPTVNFCGGIPLNMACISFGRNCSYSNVADCIDGEGCGWCETTQMCTAKNASAPYCNDCPNFLGCDEAADPDCCDASVKAITLYGAPVSSYPSSCPSGKRPSQSAGGAPTAAPKAPPTTAPAAATGGATTQPKKTNSAAIAVIIILVVILLAMAAVYAWKKKKEQGRRPVKTIDMDDSAFQPMDESSVIGPHVSVTDMNVVQL